MNEDNLRKLLSVLKLPDKRKKPPTFVLPADGNVEITSYPTCIIKNTNKAGVTTMGHWIAFYVPSKGKYEIFDSYGLPLSRYPDVVPPPGRCIAENCHTVQASDSYLCGYYCAWFLWHRSSGYIYRTFMRNFSDKLHRNDDLVIRIIMSYTHYTGFSMDSVHKPTEQICGPRHLHCEWKEPVNKVGKRARF